MRKILIVLSLLLASCNGMKELTMDKDKFLAKADTVNVTGVQQTLLASAQNAERVGDYKVAGQYYQQLMDMDKANKDYAAAFADVQRKAGQPDQAIAMYDSILLQDAGFVPAVEGKAIALLVKGAFEPADLLFSQVTQKDPSRWRSWNGLGITRAAKENYADSKTMFDKAISLSPNNTAIMNNQGLLLAIQRDHAGGISSLRTASAIAPSGSPQQKQIDLNLALVYAVSGDLKSAEATAGKYYSGAALSNNMGFYAHIANNNDLATTYLNMALTQSPTYYERAWRNLEAVSNKDNSAPLPNTESKRIEVPDVGPTNIVMPSPSANTNQSTVQQLQLPPSMQQPQALPVPAAVAAPVPLYAPTATVTPTTPAVNVPAPEAAPAAVAPASGAVIATQPALEPVKKKGTMDSVTDWFGDLVK